MERGLFGRLAAIRKAGSDFTVRTRKVPLLTEILEDAAEWGDSLEPTLPAGDSHRMQYARE